MPMRLVSSYGSIYRISDREYVKQLLSIISGEGYRINPNRYLGEVECNLTDLTPTEASSLLESYKNSGAARTRVRDAPGV